MKALSLLLILVSLLLQTLAFAQTEESNIDFTVSPGIILDGKIQVAFKWITPSEFRKTDLSLMDLPKISEIQPSNNQLVVSKIAFISKKSFDNLSYVKMNSTQFISDMLNSVGIRQKESDLWYVTNRVKAYNIPFKVSFDFRFKEIAASSLNSQVVNYLKDEASGVKGTGRERFMTLDMSNFSQLMYRNYSVVYMKEISANETMIVSGIIGGLNLNTANSFFNYPPFSSTKSTMVGNLRDQILHMARSIQK
jgi:hypothetical protein